MSSFDPTMQDDRQYWCYINNSKEFEYIKNLPQVEYGNARLEHFPEFPIVFNLDLRGISYTPFWVFGSDSRFPQCPDLYPEFSFEEMKSQIFIYQLTL